MVTMTTANFQIGEGKSYEGMRENHYELNHQKSACRDQKDYSFQIHKRVILDSTAFNDLQKKQEKIIDERNAKYEKRREYAKQDKNLKAYFKRRSESDARKRNGKQLKADYDNNFPIILEASNSDDLERFKSALMVNDDVARRLHSEGLERAIRAFNEDSRFNDKMRFDEYYLHANEKGIPHLHARLLLDDYDRYGNPNGNLSRTLRDKYNTKSAADALSMFRDDVDNLILDNVKQVMLEYVVSNERDDFTQRVKIKQVEQYCTLERTGGRVFRDQADYKANLKLEEAKEAEEKARIKARKLEERERLLAEREAELDAQKQRIEAVRLQLEDLEDKLKWRQSDLEQKQSDLERVYKSTFSNRVNAVYAMGRRDGLNELRERSVDDLYGQALNYLNQTEGSGSSQSQSRDNGYEFDI